VITDYLVWADVPISFVAYVALFTLGFRKSFVRETRAWWIFTDLYFETRPFVMPHFSLVLITDILQGISQWIIILQVLIMMAWWWLINNDEDDPRDRWKRRRDWVRKLFTIKIRVPVPVRA
jgi:hypothetical protein